MRSENQQDTESSKAIKSRKPHQKYHLDQIVPRVATTKIQPSNLEQPAPNISRTIASN